MARPAIPVGQWGEITLRQLENGSWRARTKFRDVDKLREVARFAGTKAKAEQSLKAALRARSSERLTPQATLAQLSEEWLAELQAGDLAIGTKRTYRQMTTKHILGGTLAETQLNELSVAKVSGLLRNIKGDGARKSVRACLRAILDLGVHNELIPLNPVRAVRPQAPRRQAQPTEGARDTRRALTADERATLVAAMATSAHAARYDLTDLVHFMLGTGCRIGEACALTWDKFRKFSEPGKGGTVAVSATVVRVPGEGLVIQPYTKTGQIRTLFISPELSSRLNKRRSRSELLIFPSPLRKLRDPSNTEHWLRKLFDEAGFPWMTSHTFRRTVATVLDENGFTPREVSNQLGHKRISMTTDVYLDRRQPVVRAAEVL